ncbi:MAG TPA: TIGR01777 family oxidoreductase, partial [Planctomycetaceae bacterium]|nr:TIGR01777 family oxidoreductase [Planctomycetaceae bacterium]
EGFRTWNPDAEEFDPAWFDGFDSVVHLAGENIAGGRWTKSYKQKILSSRRDVTRKLATALTRLEQPPRTLISASAVGWYGDRGDELLTESSSRGNGFLAEVCQEWEQAANPAREAGIRVVHPRIGVVLSPKGGALKKMLPIFRLGLGGVLGHGRQYMSWIGLDDLAGAIFHLLTDESLTGPVNCVAPNPVTNREFTKTLGRVLSRPAILPVPGFMAKLGLGQMAEELLLSGARVLPEVLSQSGYGFRSSNLEECLRSQLGKPLGGVSAQRR